MCTLMNGEVVKRVVRCDLHEERAHVRCQGVHPSSVARELHGTLDKLLSLSVPHFPHLNGEDVGPTFWRCDFKLVTFVQWPEDVIFVIVVPHRGYPDV